MARGMTALDYRKKRGAYAKGKGTTWTDSKGKIISGKRGTKEKVGQDIKNVRWRQEKVLTPASKLASKFAKLFKKSKNGNKRVISRRGR